MSEPRLRILSLGVDVDVDPTDAAVESVPSWADAVGRLDRDAVVVDAQAHPLTAEEVAALAARTPVIAVGGLDPATAAAWLRGGADDVLARDDLAAGALILRIGQAIARREGAARRGAAYSTDVDTGLPHRQQLVEHLSQLLALREREPSPMAVLALRVFAGASVLDPSAERALLRRKVGVRLRAGLRASDVVAAVDDDAFAVLLGSILEPGDADRVAAKLVAALVAPFPVAGGERTIAVSSGIAHVPQDGRDAEQLLRRALALAAAAPAAGRDAAGVAGVARTAANDDA